MLVRCATQGGTIYKRAAAGRVRAFSAAGRHSSGSEQKGSGLQLVQQQRKSMQAQHQAMVMQINGVTFEGRQTNLKRCREGQPVQLTMEPDNPYDKNAVHITDIRGASLGFVPRDLTYNICYPVSFGFIYSMGRVTSVLSEPLGATVQVQPTLPSLDITIHPANLRDAMANVYSHPKYKTLSKAMLDASEQRCIITGLPAAAVVPRWLFMRHTQELRLMALYPMCQELVQLLTYEHGTDEERRVLRPQVVQVLEMCHKWRADEAERYLKKQEQLVEERQGKEWRVDVSLLGRNVLRLGPLTPPGNNTVPRRS